MTRSARVARSGAGSGSRAVRRQRSANSQGRSDVEAASRGLMRFLPEPVIDGPRVRVGALWFFVALAAITSGRYSTALLWALVSGSAGYQVVGVWQGRQGSRVPNRRAARDQAAGTRSGGGGDITSRLLAFAGAATLPIVAAYSTGAAGLAMIMVPFVVIAFHVGTGRGALATSTAVVGALLPAFAAVAVVLVVRADIWAGIFLVMAVSLYDAGAYLLGSEASSRWEGPVAGMIGTLAVTFTMAAFHPSPFDVASVWSAGVIVALACPVGQALVSAFLPMPATDVRSLRRLDAYLISAPAFVICIYLAGI